MSDTDSWYHEKESAWLYGRVAALEPDPAKSRMFRQLGEAAEEQALKWQALEPTRSYAFTPSLRARIVAALVSRFGPRATRHVLAAMKLRGVSVYSGSTAAGHAMPTTLAQVGQRHRGVSGGNLRATVFGINDGLVSNAALVMGVAGAGSSPSTVLVTGVAGLLAGALSMAAGEYVSVRSQRDMYEYQIALEKEELDEYPEEEAEELALIYAARGMDIEQARQMTRALVTRPEQALDVLAREELGLNPDDLGSPWGAAISSFIAFSVGAILPLLPFLLGPTLGLAAGGAIGWTVAITVLALAGIGMAISLFTGRDAGRGALRMVLIGGGAGVIAWLVGRLLGVALG
ncbi:MAG: VIT1/CCC1 transporter family protein [Gammaproteobacteria bacterium]|nr:VIT1/CCC1 transporter family protein [Gammaproteobacteria bacterium]